MTETVRPQNGEDSAATAAKSTGWQRTRTLCGVVGFLSGSLGIFAGFVLATTLGIDSRLSGSNDPAAASQLPVQVTSRSRSDGDGIVIQVRNTSSRVLRSVVIRMSAPGHDNPRTLTLDAWDPGGLAEIGEDDGWRVGAGQKLSISAAGYEPAVITIN